jgi:ABC-type lipoprotein export system ATPase subunit
VGGLLRFENVSKRYTAGTREVVALDGVTLGITEGELVALVGKSGSGKSTLLHLAGGLDVADSGTVHLGDRDVGQMGIAERSRLRRREIGFVFQFFHLIPTLSVLENVELPLLLDGAKRGTRGRELLDRVGLGDRADHLPGELSGGEMQRAAVARALVARPRLLLADEPTGNLDSANGEEVLRLLKEEVRQEGTALLMVTHDEDAAARADHVHRLADGHLVDSLPPADTAPPTWGSAPVPAPTTAPVWGAAPTPEPVGPVAPVGSAEPPAAPGPPAAPEPPTPSEPAAPTTWQPPPGPEPTAS